MELKNEFRVGVPVDEAWLLLTDVERIAPCLPGAQLQEIDGDEYRGIVKVKVGPITAQYKGAATFVERDDAGKRAVLRAEGRETRGQGNANATITATLTPDGAGTAVTVVTDLMVTGKVAQFGRGVLADVSTKLLNQFVECLESTVLGGSVPVTVAAATAEGAVASEIGDVLGGVAANGHGRNGPARSDERGDQAEPATGPRRIDSPEPRPVDLLDTAGAPVAKRVAPAVGVLAILWLIRILVRRRRRR